jgi:hypothetical protein
MTSKDIPSVNVDVNIADIDDVAHLLELPSQTSFPATSDNACPPKDNKVIASVSSTPAPRAIALRNPMNDCKKTNFPRLTAEQLLAKTIDLGNVMGDPLEGPILDRRQHVVEGLTFMFDQLEQLTPNQIAQLDRAYLNWSSTPKRALLPWERGRMDLSDDRAIRNRSFALLMNFGMREFEHLPPGFLRAGECVLDCFMAKQVYPKEASGIELPFALLDLVQMDLTDEEIHFAAELMSSLSLSQALRVLEIVGTRERRAVD